MENTIFYFASFLFQLILISVLNCFFDAVSTMLRKNVEKRFLMEHLDAVLLAIDELVDGGYVKKLLLCFLSTTLSAIILLWMTIIREQIIIHFAHFAMLLWVYFSFLITRSFF